MKWINGKRVKAKEFAFDGCHKIYLLDRVEDRTEALEVGYEILPIKQLRRTYECSCPLKFIHNWQLNKTYVEQGSGRPEFEE